MSRSKHQSVKDDELAFAYSEGSQHKASQTAKSNGWQRLLGQWSTRSLFACGLAASYCSTVAAQPVSFNVMVRSGETAPPGNGRTFTTLMGPPVINNSGRIAFTANMAGPGITSSNDSAIWTTARAVFELVAQEGGPHAIGGLDRLADLILADNGTLAFANDLQNFNRAVWSWQGGQLSLLVSENQPVSSTHSFQSVTDIAFNGNTALFRCLVGPIGTSFDALYLSSNSLDRQQVVGQGGPTSLPGLLYSQLSANSLSVLNGMSHGVIFSTVQGSGVTPENDSRFFSGSFSQLGLTLQEGSVAPLESGSGVFSSFFGVPSINNRGEVLFFARATVGLSARLGLWLSTTDGPVFVARQSSPAPGTPVGVTFSSVFEDLKLSGRGHVAFGAEVAGSGVTTSNNRGIWAGFANSLALIAREGSQAPGTPPGVVFSTFGAPVINLRGQVAFQAVIRGPGIGAGNRDGIWMTTPQGDLQLVVRSGDAFGALTLSTPSIRDKGGPEDGRERCLNDRGQLAFMTAFTNGSRAIIIASSPCELPAQTEQIQDQALDCGVTSTSITAVVASADSASYLWRRNGVPLNTIEVPSATSSTLVLTGLTPSDSGTYDCLVTSVCGSLHTNSCVLTVPLCNGTCESLDFNRDGLFPDDADLLDFLGVLAGRACSTENCNDLDFNNDGLFPDDNDLVSFLRVLAGGSC